MNCSLMKPGGLNSLLLLLLLTVRFSPHRPHWTPNSERGREGERRERRGKGREEEERREGEEEGERNPLVQATVAVAVEVAVVTAVTIIAAVTTISVDGVSNH